MKDLIDRQSVLDIIFLDPGTSETQAKMIINLPSAEKKGKWIKTGNKIEKGLREIWWFECSECGFRLRFPIDRIMFNYCPRCGSKNEVTE